MNLPSEFHLLSIEVQKQLLEAQVKIAETDLQRKQAELLLTYKDEPDKLKELFSYISSGL